MRSALARTAPDTKDRAALALRAREFTEREVAEFLGVSHRTVGRGVNTSLSRILSELGGVYAPTAATSAVSACLKCGQRPRARHAEIRRKIRGGSRQVSPERTASLCRECTPPERRHLLVGYVPPEDDGDD